MQYLLHIKAIFSYVAVVVINTSTYTYIYAHNIFLPKHLPNRKLLGAYNGPLFTLHTINVISSLSLLKAYKILQQYEPALIWYLSAE